jgi:hypothetical protein
VRYLLLLGWHHAKLLSHVRGITACVDGSASVQWVLIGEGVTRRLSSMTTLMSASWCHRSLGVRESAKALLTAGLLVKTLRSLSAQCRLLLRKERFLLERSSKTLDVLLLLAGNILEHLTLLLLLQWREASQRAHRRSANSSNRSLRLLTSFARLFVSRVAELLLLLRLLLEFTPSLPTMLVEHGGNVA